MPYDWHGKAVKVYMRHEPWFKKDDGIRLSEANASLIFFSGAL